MKSLCSKWLIIPSVERQRRPFRFYVCTRGGEEKRKKSNVYSLFVRSRRSAQVSVVKTTWKQKFIYIQRRWSLAENRNRAIRQQRRSLQAPFFVLFYVSPTTLWKLHTHCFQGAALFIQMHTSMYNIRSNFYPPSFPEHIFSELLSVV